MLFSNYLCVISISYSDGMVGILVRRLGMYVSAADANGGSVMTSESPGLSSVNLGVYLENNNISRNPLP